MSRERKRPQETPENLENGRERILRAAQKLFGERGFDGASVRDIAAEAGVSLGLVRHHFGSKDDLRRAVGAMVIERFIRYLGTLSGDEPVNPMAAMAAASVRQLEEDPEGARSAWLYYRRSLFEADEMAREYVKVYRELYRQILDRMVAAGKWRADLDPEMLVFLLMARDFGEVFLWPYADDFFRERLLSKEMFQRLVTAEMDVLERGVLEREPDRAPEPATRARRQSRGSRPVVRTAKAAQAAGTRRRHG